MGEGEKKERRFSPSALFLFHFYLSPFLPETPESQATKKPTNSILYWNPVPRRPPFLHVMQRSSFKYNVRSIKTYVFSPSKKII